MDSSSDVKVEQLDSFEVAVIKPEKIENDPVVVKTECQEFVTTVNDLLQVSITKEELDLEFVPCNIKEENDNPPEHSLVDPSEPSDVKGVFNNSNSEGDNFETVHQCKYICKVCNVLYDNRHSFNKHVEIHDGYFKIPCKFCRRKFYDEAELKEHIIVHTNKSYACKVCGIKFNTQSNLRGHMLNEHLCACSFCFETFRDKESLEIHKCVHKLSNRDKKRPSNNDKFLCEICGKIFPFDCMLKRHIYATHSGVKPYSCDFCNKIFSERSGFKRHMKRHSGERPFQCDECQKTFISNHDLQKHIFSVHSKIRPHACHICQRSFPEAGNLRTHLLTHTGAKPYKCDTCGKSFAQKDSLKSHFRIHTGERPFSCEICHKTYARSTCLKSHLQIHLGNRRHSCDVCGRSFYEKSHLITHFRVHTGEKPFSCNVCGGKFTQKSSLGKHLQLHVQRGELKE